MTEKIRALSVISGGLDSILATRIVMDEGVDVTAVHFVTPFFGSHPVVERDALSQRMTERYGIRAISIDITDSYIKMLASPRYGYGKNFNPCVDCKILLFSTARMMMEEFGAGFIITGEVLGQRPMSQRRDTLRIIERDSSTTGVLLRPLSAKLLKPTVPELKGWVRRENLFGFSGRSRKPQIELASRLGITGYPAPAGGCCLTDPIQSRRIRRLYKMKETPGEREVKLIQIGRPFRLGTEAILTIGRNEEENERINELACNGDLFLKLVDLPGPLGVIVGNPTELEVNRAMAVVAYFSKARDLPSVSIGVGGRADPFKTVRDVIPADEQEIEELKF
jgi:tRNA-specific 2-thiouridylase